MGVAVDKGQEKWGNGCGGATGGGGSSTGGVGGSCARAGDATAVANERDSAVPMRPESKRKLINISSSPTLAPSTLAA